MRDGGANCSSPPSYPPEVDLSIKRPLRGLLSRARTHARTQVYPLRRALLSAASRIKLEGVSAILNFLLNPCQRVFSRTLEDLLLSHQPLLLSTPSVYPSPRLRSSTLFLPFASKDREIRARICVNFVSTRKPECRVPSTRARRSWRTTRMFEYDVNVNVCPSPDLFIHRWIFFFVADTPSPYSFSLFPLSLFRFTNRIEKFACTRQRFTT